MRCSLHSVGAAAAAFIATASSQAVSFCPNDICYAVSVPQTTVSSGNGDVYMQISAPDTYSWVGFGYGSMMAGATIFVMYADGNGNVTVSPRSGVGHVMPKYNDQASITLLAGSGVMNGNMTANFKCSGSACGTTIDVTSTSSNQIGAWLTGDPLNSTDNSKTISYHDSHSQFTMDLTTAVTTSDTNPFVSSTDATDPITPASPATSAATGSSTPSSSSNAYSAISSSQKAHGIVMGLIVAVLLPLGAMSIRIFSNIWIHVAIQAISIILLFAGLGLGVHLANQTGQLFNTTHTLFGVSVVCLFVLQPITGWLHHWMYMRKHKRTAASYVHIWYGRALIILSIINGGLGLQLADNTKGGEIAFGVVAGVMCLAWAGVVLLSWKKGGAVMGKKRAVGSKEDAGST